MSSLSPVRLEDLNAAACQIMTRVNSRSLIALATLVCSTVNDPSTFVSEMSGGGIPQSTTFNVFNYVDPLIGTNNGGMDTYHRLAIDIPSRH
jgi:hypothetical protein